MAVEEESLQSFIDRMITLVDQLLALYAAAAAAAQQHSCQPLPPYTGVPLAAPPAAPVAHGTYPASCIATARRILGKPR